jgi:hypothetical protein
LLWPTIRNLVIRIIIDHEVFGKESLIKTSPKKAASRLKVIKCLTEGLIHDLRFLNHRPQILFFNSGITNVNLDGKYLNRVSDYFAFCYPHSTLLIEEAHEWQHLRPRVNQNVAYRVPLRIVSAALSRCWPPKFEDKNIREFVEFINLRVYSIVGYQLTEEQKSFIRKNLYSYCQKLKIDLMIYSTLFRRFKPVVIFFEDGMAGWISHIIRLAKEMGIKTAEIQHGLTSSGHSAYNFAPKILQSSIYRKYTPDFYLTYGKYWEAQVCIPSQVITIGNPFYDIMKRRFNNDGVSNNDKLLLLSSGENFQFYIQMALDLRNMHINKEIFIRPHPAEKTMVLNKYGCSLEGIMIDDNDNLYSQLSQVSVVVGEVSTALFEAIGLVKKIFAISTPLNSFWLPECPFESIESAEQLATKLKENNSGEINPDLADSIWANDWEINYRYFIKHNIGLNQN